MVYKEDSNLEAEASIVPTADEYEDAEKTPLVELVQDPKTNTSAIPASPRKRLQAPDMKKWLGQYKLTNRSTTVTGAFVAALLPHDKYEHETVARAMATLGQNIAALTCVYCEGEPTTWDHLTNSVRDKKANGPGHRIYNLVPCCAVCNSSKAGKRFADWILGYTKLNGTKVGGTERVDESRREILVELLKNYQSYCPELTVADQELEAKLMEMRDRVLAIFDEADKLISLARP